MTDNEIIKAYACCNINGFGGCEECPCKIEGDCIVPSGFDLEREVFNLLNRQKAEIERLRGLVEECVDSNEAWVRDNGELRNELKTAKAEAIKEFAERLKYRTCCIPQHHFTYGEVEYHVDYLVKELIGGE